MTWKDLELSPAVPAAWNTTDRGTCSAWPVGGHIKASGFPITPAYLCAGGDRALIILYTTSPLNPKKPGHGSSTALPDRPLSISPLCETVRSELSPLKLHGRETVIKKSPLFQHLTFLEGNHSRLPHASCSLHLGAVSNACSCPCPAPHSFLQHVMAQRRNKWSLAGAACRVAVHTMASCWRGIEKGCGKLSLILLRGWLPKTASEMGRKEKKSCKVLTVNSILQLVLGHENHPDCPVSSSSAPVPLCSHLCLPELLSAPGILLLTGFSPAPVSSVLCVSAHFPTANSNHFRKG